MTIHVDDNYDLENNLGGELGFEHDFSAALPHFEKSVALIDTIQICIDLASDYEYTFENISWLKFIMEKGDFFKRNQSVESGVFILSRLLLLHNSHGSRHYLLYLEAVKKYPETWQFWLYLQLFSINFIIETLHY